MKHLLITTIAAVLVVGCGLGQDPEGALRSAALDGNIEAVKRHLAAGANVNAPNTYGWTALYWASSRGHKEIVELLIANGADVNAKDDDGNTPLHLAAGASHKEIAELLIAEGAEVNAKTKRGETPLDLAEDDPKIRNPILKHGGKMGADLGY